MAYRRPVRSGYFYRPLADLISGLTSVSVTDKNGKTIQFTASEVRGVARDLLADVDNMISGLGTDEKTLFAAIRSSAHTPKVSQVILGFRRGTKEHDSLRKLRDAQLIRPVGGGPWSADSFIELKSFGRTILKIRADQLKP